MKTKMKIANRTATKNENSDEYTINFKSKESVCRFYENVKKICTTTNFGLNPFEKNAYGVFTLDGDEYIIDPPRNYNGDNNWTSYPNINCFATIRK